MVEVTLGEVENPVLNGLVTSVSMSGVVTAPVVVVYWVPGCVVLSLVVNSGSVDMVEETLVALVKSV